MQDKYASVLIKFKYMKDLVKYIENFNKNILITNIKRNIFRKNGTNQC